MRFRLKGCQDSLLAAINKPEEMPDYLFRQLGFNQTWHEWKRDRVGSLAAAACHGLKLPL
ncbi:hypothetical protein KX464_25465 [Escherichia coli]|nr:hypothetical protein [Escherichia coli]